MSNSTLKILLALMVAITAALVTQPMRAGVLNTLVLTETSSTSLTALLNGITPLSVSNPGRDSWRVSLTGINEGQQDWLEPEAGFVNAVAGLPSENEIVVVSDFGPGRTGLADGTQDTTHFTLNGNPLYVTFFDKGDVATTPDTGTTVSLFGLSLTGLAFLRRKLC
ncbi:MAG: hypothetical protein DME58_05395 [Verrucomicrobia bacterium]|nr:MAG: hypothetical protein DMF05_10430 [Verrucomicrobiota bacterium]PYK32569.1 MAG: hypothetical protein DME58_05395 [Verrucomicrobiota bacterium]